MVIIDILSTTSWSSVFVVQWPVGRLMWYVDLCIHSAHCNEKWACIASKMTATRAKGAAMYRANALGTMDCLYHPKSIDIHKLHMMNIGTKQQMTWVRIERRIAQFHAASSDSMIHCVSKWLMWIWASSTSRTLSGGTFSLRSDQRNRHKKLWIVMRVDSVLKDPSLLLETLVCQQES